MIMEGPNPLPAHVAFCNLQSQLNQHLSGRMHVMPMAVGATSDGRSPLTAGAGQVRPDATPDGAFPFVSIDGYVRDNNLRVGVIKMDIEGGEGAALDGARETTARFRPRLRISAHHRPDDLWVLRARIEGARARTVVSISATTPPCSGSPCCMPSESAP